MAEVDVINRKDKIDVHECKSDGISTFEFIQVEICGIIEKKFGLQLD